MTRERFARFCQQAPQLPKRAVPPFLCTWHRSPPTKFDRLRVLTIEILSDHRRKTVDHVHHRQRNPVVTPRWHSGIVVLRYNDYNYYNMCRTS
jgi:hypothetical protein